MDMKAQEVEASPQEIESDYLRIEDAAIYLNVSVSTLRKWVQSRKIPYYKPGKNLLFKKCHMDNFMKNHFVRAEFM